MNIILQLIVYKKRKSIHTRTEGQNKCCPSLQVKKKKENCLISAIDIYDIRLIPITVYSIVIAQNYSSLMAVRN